MQKRTLRSYTRGTDIRNNGGNRLNCFPCDFDMCAECGRIEMRFNVDK